LTAGAMHMCPEGSGKYSVHVQCSNSPQKRIINCLYMCRWGRFIPWSWSAGRSCCIGDCADACSSLYCSTPYLVEVRP